MFANICVSGGPGVGQEEAGAAKEGSIEIELKKVEGVGLVAVAIAVTIIIFIFGYLLECILDRFAPLLGALLQTFTSDIIGHINGDINDFIQACTFIDLCGALIGYTVAPIIGAGTKDNNGYIGIDTEAHIGAGLTNFIGFNGLSYPQRGATTVGIVSGSLFCFNEYCNGFEIDRGAILAAIAIIVERIRFKTGLLGGGFKSLNGVFLATTNTNTGGLFGAPFGAFDTTNRGDIKGGTKGEFEGVVVPHTGTYYDFDFKKEREIEVKGFKYGIYI